MKLESENQQSVERPGSSNGRYLKRVIAQVTRLVRDVAPGSKTTGRVKALEATTSKALRHAAGAIINPDKIGIRVIVRDVQQCFSVVKLLRQKLICLEEFFDDYINFPKENGYQSLHLAVRATNGLPFEVQVRTQGMHACAEKGSAAHHLYKIQQGGR